LEYENQQELQKGLRGIFVSEVFLAPFLVVHHHSAGLHPLQMK
jgi:hypothetical protein